MWMFYMLVLLAQFVLLLNNVGIVAFWLRTWLRQWFRRCRRVCKTDARSASLRGETGSVSILLPCYLPNERFIIMETIEHLLNELEYESSAPTAEEEPLVTVFCAYNAPPSWRHPIEDQLASMNGMRLGKYSRLFRAVRVEGSTSKSANLNCIMEEIDGTYTAIYDADHHPDPESLRLMVEMLEAEGADCIQGSTYIRNSQTILGRIIDAEFFFTHFLIFPALAMLSSTGFFGGSNAVWRTAALHGNEFNNEVQTEDIEFSMRALLQSAKIRFCPQARSGELPPLNARALWKQRLRWAMGWDQVTLMHCRAILRTKEISCVLRVGMYWMLVGRWLCLFFMLVNGVVAPGITVADDFCSHYFVGYKSIMRGRILDALEMQFVNLSTTLTLAVLLILVYERPLWPTLCRQAVFCLGYLFLAPLQLLFQLAVVLASMRKLLSGDAGGWIVTLRHDAGAASGEADPCRLPRPRTRHQPRQPRRRLIAESRPGRLIRRSVSIMGEASRSLRLLLGPRFQFADDATGAYGSPRPDAEARNHCAQAGAACAPVEIELAKRGP